MIDTVGTLLAASAVTLLALLAIAAAVARRSRWPRARLAPDGAQEMTIHVKGNYSPRGFSVRAGRPLRLHFVRDEDRICSERVFIPDFDVERRLPAHRATTIELFPEKRGEFLFTCRDGIYIGLIRVGQHDPFRWLAGLDRLVRSAGGAIRTRPRHGAAGGPRPSS